MRDSSEYVELPSPPAGGLKVSSERKRVTDNRMRADSFRLTSKMWTMSRMRLRSVQPRAVLVSGTTWLCQRLSFVRHSNLLKQATTHIFRKQLQVGGMAFPSLPSILVHVIQLGRHADRRQLIRLGICEPLWCLDTGRVGRQTSRKSKRVGLQSPEHDDQFIRGLIVSLGVLKGLNFKLTSMYVSASSPSGIILAKGVLTALPARRSEMEVSIESIMTITSSGYCSYKTAPDCWISWAHHDISPLIVRHTLTRPSPTARVTLSARSPPPPSSCKTASKDLYSSSSDDAEARPAGTRYEKNCSCKFSQLHLRVLQASRHKATHSQSHVQPLPAFHPAPECPDQIIDDVLPWVDIVLVVASLALLTCHRLLLGSIAIPGIAIRHRPERESAK